MSVKERLKADPGIMLRAMRCESFEDIELLLKVEGITRPEDIEEAYSLLELGDKALEAVAGGKTPKIKLGLPKMRPVKFTGRPITAGGRSNGLGAVGVDSSSLAKGAGGFANASKLLLQDMQGKQAKNSNWFWGDCW